MIRYMFPTRDGTAVKSVSLRALLGCAALGLSACAPLQPDTPLVASVMVSPNFDERQPDFVVIHHTGSKTLEDAQRILTTPLRKVSAHYLISRDGAMIQLVGENARAWHAGKSWWGGLTDLNSVSIGIELDNNGREPFADAQIDALLALLTDIRQRHAIPAANFIGHADIAPTRKDDPSSWFPWQKLAAQGFGLWCELPLPPAPAGFDLALALTAIGYDPATPEASLRAFRRHFVPEGSGYSAEQESALALCLLQKKAARSR